jgi:chromosomal replication initiation ATPase DnaA
MSGRRQRTISLARSVAMFLVRKTAKLSFPEIGQRMGKRNHSTVISACRRIERAVQRNEPLLWNSTVGPRQEEAAELIQRLEEHGRAMR